MGEALGFSKSGSLYQYINFLNQTLTVYWLTSTL